MTLSRRPSRHADATGRLRGILDAVRSHRIEDDFSEHWSYAREDFERKLHGKRRKVKVTFVEVPDTIPVQGPESEVVGNLVTNDFLALLDARNQQIVVLLSSGVTSRHRDRRHPRVRQPQCGLEAALADPSAG